MSVRGIALYRSPSEAAEWCRGVREDGRSLGLVPTMGALHEGHLALVRRAVSECDAVCASIFVNPLQFDDPRDYQRYPRDLERDASLLESAGCDMAFTGTLSEFFPASVRADGSFEPADLVDPGPAASGLEGEFRAGHFRGVATIVDRLFRIVRPDRAYFGQKDFQQTLVVQDLVRARGGPRIVVCPTVREPSGLALSSRNVLLPPRDTSAALAISRALFAARAAWWRGERDAERLTRLLQDELASSSLTLEYAEVRDPERWSAGTPSGRLERAVALVAARAGSIRLIDNVILHTTTEDEPCRGA